jgi:hypothetical protein
MPSSEYAPTNTTEYLKKQLESPLISLSQKLSLVI